MNRFLILSITSIVLLTNPFLCAQETGASGGSDGGSAFFREQLGSTALFSQHDTNSTLPNRVVPAEYLPTAEGAADSPTGKHQPGVLGNRGNDLSFLDDSNEPSKPATIVSNASTLLWQLAAVLAFALMAVALVFVKKSMHKSPAVDAGQLALIGTISLSHRSVVQLVAAGNSVLAVASDTSGVKSMVRIPQQFADMLEPDPEPETLEGQHV